MHRKQIRTYSFVCKRTWKVGFRKW
jgi:hypothetical protein